MSQFRKVELIESQQGKGLETPEDKINLTVESQKNDGIAEKSKINENIVKIIENIVGKYLDKKNKRIKKSIKVIKKSKPYERKLKNKTKINWFIPK